MLTTTVVALVLIVSNGRQIYRAAFMSTNDVRTRNIALWRTRGKFRFGSFMSPMTKLIYTIISSKWLCEGEIPVPFPTRHSNRERQTML
jgi:hypothetical protein